MLLLFKKIGFTGLTVVSFTCCLFAQVEINNTLIFTNENDTLSQIENIGEITHSHDLITFENTTSEKYISLQLSGAGNYSFTKPYLDFILSDGMQFNLLIDTANTVSPTLEYLSIVYPIIFQDGSTIPALRFQNNFVVRVIFNGTEFRVLQYFRNSCPNGFISVNENYCIEINERPTTIFTSAIAICQAVGGNLCSWGEWYYACANLSGQVLNMTNNWEFIDDASDHNETNAVIGAPGFGGCESFFSENVDLFNRNFRCCYKK